MDRMRKGRALGAALIAMGMAGLGLANAPAVSAAANVTVCAFGCDATTLQAGVDLVDAGGTVEVGDGLYTEAVVINKNVTIDGDPNLGRVKVTPAAGPAFTVDGGTVTIKDFEIKDIAGDAGVEVNGGSLTLTGNDFQNNTVQIVDNTAGGINLGTALANNTFDQAVVVKTGVDFRSRGVFRTVAEGLTIAQNGDVIEVSASDDNLADDYTENVTVAKDVTVRGVDGAATTRVAGTLAVTASGASVEGLTIRDAVTVADAIDDVHLEDNVFEAPVTVGDATHVDVHTNTFKNDNAVALTHRASNSEVSENTFTGTSTDAAIDLFGDDLELHDNVVDGKAKSGNPADPAVALRLNGTEGVEAAGNTLSNNDLGVLITGTAKDVELLGNQINGNAAHGVSITLGAAGNNGGHFNDIAGNGGASGFGVNNRSDHAADFSHNWWGNAGGPSDPNNPASVAPVPATGDRVFGTVDWTSWCVTEGCTDEPLQSNLPF